MTHDTDKAVGSVKLSIVSTLYLSEAFIGEFISRCVATASQITTSFEIVLIDDGSPDASIAVAKEMAKTDARIRPLALSRNFGHHNAILAGLSVARGEYVFYVDSDLEEPPENLTAFWEELHASNCDVVYGYQRQDQGSWWRQATSSLFWRLFSFLAQMKIHPNLCHIRLMRRRYVDALLSMPERNVFLGGMYAWPGFIQKPTLVERRLRRAKSTYSGFARIKLFAKSLVSFSAMPLYAIFFIGMTITCFALIFAGYYIIIKIMNPDSIQVGFTMLIVSIWLVGGIMISMLGLISIYLAKMFEELKARPRYILKDFQ